MSSPEVPEPWASAMVAARLTDPRNGNPSMTRLAEAMDSTTSTVSAMISGQRRTSSKLIARAAVALRMEDRADEVFSWVGVAVERQDPFRAHPDADLLSAEERKAVNNLISLLVRERRKELVPQHYARRIREAQRELSVAEGPQSDALPLAANLTDEHQQEPGAEEDPHTT